MDLATAFGWTVDRCLDQRAVGGSRPMTYREWDARTNQLARVLLDLGVRAGDRLALSLAGGSRWPAFTSQRRSWVRPRCRCRHGTRRTKRNIA